MKQNLNSDSWVATDLLTPALSVNRVAATSRLDPRRGAAFTLGDGASQPRCFGS